MDTLRPIVFLLCASFVSFSCHLHEPAIDIRGFGDSARHWYGINDEVPKLIKPEPGQEQYDPDQIAEIADNILLYQRSNGGWVKNYDMQAVLTDEQKQSLLRARDDISLTTFDNGTTHAQIEYLARVYARIPDPRYQSAVLRGIHFILSAQYPNGGFPQFFPDTSGYRKHITFNDGAMTGVMEVFRRIVRNEPQYAFIGDPLRQRVRFAYEKGIDCILRCQIRVNDTLTAWCQQHDHVDCTPQNARTFEPKAICSLESSEIVLLLMKIDKPSPAVVNAVNSAVAWFQRSKISGIRVETVKAPKEKFIYHTSDEDRIVVQDKDARPLWTRMYQIESNTPMFCRRDGTIVYTLAEVERERRTGYKWYCEEPEEVMAKYAQWQKKWSPDYSAI
jgi:PelA/Pel-15E family pectate lyase